MLLIIIFCFKELNVKYLSLRWGSKRGCGFYDYRLKFWPFHDPQLIFFQLWLTKKLIIKVS